MKPHFQSFVFSKSRCTNFIHSLFALFYFGLFSPSYFAQQILIHNGTESDCDFTLYDTGGVSAAGYSANQDFTLTICPDNPGSAINITWFTFNLGSGDFMELYDGNSMSAPSLGSYSGSQLNNKVSYASINNPSGCLTLHFVSDATNHGVFNGAVKCEIPCAYPNAGVVLPTTPTIQICKDQVVAFDGSASTAMPTFTISKYIWDFGNGDIDTTLIPTTNHTFTSSGRYIVSLDVLDNNGCKNKNAAFTEVLVAMEPTYTITTPPAVCPYESYCLDVAAELPPFPKPKNDVFADGIHIPDNVGQCFEATQYFSVFPVGALLTNISQLNNIYANMSHTFIGDLIITIISPSGQSVILHQQGGGGANLGGDYYWDPNSTNGTWATNYSGPGTYESVQPLSGLVGSELNGTWTLRICDMWAQDQGDVWAWGMNFDTSLYVNLPALSATVTGTSFTGPGAFSLSSNGDTLCTVQALSGNYTYTYSVTNNFGCTNDTSFSANVKPAPIAAFNATSVCEGIATTFADLSTPANPLPNKVAEWYWDFTTNGTVDNATASPTFVFPASGNYIASLIVVSENGCKDTAAVPVDVWGYPIANFTATDACFGSSTIFTDVTDILTNANVGGTPNYTWNFDDGSVVSTNANPTHQYSLGGNANAIYDVSLIATSVHGCADTITKPVNVFANPVPAFTLDKPAGCPLHCVTFTDATPSGINPSQNAIWDWYFGDGSKISSTTNSTQLHCYDNSSTTQVALFDVKLVVTTNKGCKDSVVDVSAISVYPNPIADYTPDPPYTTVVTPLIYYINNSVDYTKWWWDFGDFSSIDSVNTNISHYYDSYNPATYQTQLIVENSYGCRDTATKPVEIKPGFIFFAPNAFTPGNGDDVNNTFRGQGVGVDEFEMWIFNRWGKSIYYTTDITKGWDGRVGGDTRIAQQDVYVWKVRIKDTQSKIHNLLGHVTLIR
ncbi:MAG: PKD domain-containing protein [Bacteroidetes bacterium]|nr:PKD domain-containing protein [Bacteroidota bacterium]